MKKQPSQIASTQCSIVNGASTFSHPINRSPKALRRAGKIQNLIILIKQRTYQRLPPAKPSRALVLAPMEALSGKAPYLPAKPNRLTQVATYRAYRAYRAHISHAYPAPFPSATLGLEDNL
jgi:hypothetical protein